MREKGHVKTEAKIGVVLPEAKGSLGPWKRQRRILDFGLLASRIVRTNFYCFKPACLWHFVATALGS